MESNQLFKRRSGSFGGSVKIALFGYGRINQGIANLANDQGDKIVALFSRNFQKGDLKEADIAIDFSSAECVLTHIELACFANIPIVIGTTGWENKEIEGKKLIEKHQNSALFSPNFSLGIYLFTQLVKKASNMFKKVEEYGRVGIETHHAKKKDSPSGTAKMLQTYFPDQFSFQSIRLGSHPGKHEILFDSPYDSIRLVHEARNTQGFATGALKAARWLIGKKGWYTIEDVYRSLYSNDHTL